jgi:hypothetical protein
MKKSIPGLSLVPRKFIAKRVAEPKNSVRTLNRYLGCLAGILALFFLATGSLATQIVATYVSRTPLGDGVIYKYAFTSSANTDTVYIMGQQGTGIVSTNLNDVQATFYYDSSEDTTSWAIAMMGSPIATATKADWSSLHSHTETHAVAGVTTYYLTFTAAEMANFPYQSFRLIGQGAANDVPQTVTVYLFYDIDPKYIGGL